MAVPFAQFAFSKGEIAPSLWGHVDLAAWHIGLTTCRNMWPGFRGGAYSRAGTAFVGISKQRPDLGQPPPRIIEWDFNVNQDYVIEFGDFYARFMFRGAEVVEVAVNLFSTTNTNPVEITTIGPHGYSGGDWIIIRNVLGEVELNGNAYIVDPAGITATTFFILDTDGNPVDGGAFGVYAGSGSAARIYEIASPYAAVDLKWLKFTQSADVMSLTCVNADTGTEYPRYDLKRLAPLNWTLTPTPSGAAISPPDLISAFATSHPTSLTSPPIKPAAYAYVATAIDAVTGEESQASPIANITDGVDMAETAGSNVVQYAQVSGASLYNLYRAPTSYNTNPSSTTNALPVPVGALFGFIGSSLGNQFVDSNIVPDFSKSPPLHLDPFARGRILQVFIDTPGSGNSVITVSISTATGADFAGNVVVLGGGGVAVEVVNAGHDYLPVDSPIFAADGVAPTGHLLVGPQTGTYPGVVSYFQQRRAYAQTLNAPDERWYSKPGEFTNFDTSIPVEADDSISGTPWSQKVDGVQWMLAMPLGLLSFSASGVWQDGPAGSGFSSPAAITPTNQLASPQSSIGCSPTVPPLRVNWDVLYLEYMNSAVLDLAYQIFFNIYAGTDISWASSHLLQDFQILQWAYTRTPNRLIWSVRNEGTLLSLTYVKEQEVVGWARHDTQGLFRSICRASENPVDALYLVVERPVAAGGTRFFKERMNDRQWSGENVWCIDCGVATVPMTPNATISANASSGSATFIATGPTSASAGNILRMGGGIARITALLGPNSFIADWLISPTAILPNDPNRSVVPQPVGAWSIGIEVTSVSGLAHLKGRQVVGVADGVPIGPLVVSPVGTVTLPFPASLIILGLGFTAQMQTLYLDSGQAPTIQGRRRNVYAATARVERGSLPQIGANQSDQTTVNWPNMTQTKPSDVDPPLVTYTSPGGAVVQPPFNGDVRANVASGWNKRAQIAVQQMLPLPLNVTAIVWEALPGDMPEIAVTPRQQRGQQQTAE